MYRPTNLSLERQLKENLQLADAALNDPSLVPNHIEAKLPLWLLAYKKEALEVIEADSGDDELIQRLFGNVSRVDKALLAYY